MCVINLASHNDRFVKTINLISNWRKVLPSLLSFPLESFFLTITHWKYPDVSEWGKSGAIEGMFNILWHQLSIFTENWKFQITVSDLLHKVWIHPWPDPDLANGRQARNVKNITAVAGMGEGYWEGWRGNGRCHVFRFGAIFIILSRGWCRVS